MSANSLDRPLLLAAEWQVAYPHVANVVREYLSTLPVYEMLSTDELVEHLIPPASCRGDDVTVRNRVYKALAALATHDLADCATRGPERRMAKLGKNIRPWLWHAPVPLEPGTITCPHCLKHFIL
ncbi:MAG: hypothetical protein P4N59_11615 [Negativicutes bacterium]|nr:hypothetical protein [Negativicutes bacterium]